jgi:hypothetical protein
MERAPGERRRRIGRIAAAVGGGLALVATLLPLVLRGPVARWAVSRATASLCGTFQISGGHLGWAAVWELLFGRPVDLVAENVRIAGPDGEAVFAAERLEATLEIHTGPFRVVLSDVLMARGRWRLALLPDQVQTADAFRALPDAGRAACLDRNAPRKRAKPGKASGSIVLRNIQFQDVDVDLAFDGWELELARANANGQLSAGGEGPPLLFEARDVVAAKGALRLGRRGNAWTARVPFDAVEIARVGVTPELPTDLELQVTSARTGRASLQGHAAFRNIFPARIGQPPPGEPGLDVDARWTAFGAALGGLDAGWRPQGPWASHLDGDLQAKVMGPFRGMAGRLEISGDGTRVVAQVAHGAADLELAFAGVETGWMVDPALRPLLGGLLHGHFHATAHLWPTFAGIDAEIPDADLRLDRRRAPSGPRRFQLRIGKGSRAEGAADTLYASVDSVRLADAVLRFQGLRADWTGLSARLDARVAFSQPGSVSATPAGHHRPRSEVEAHGQLAVAALEDWIPGGAVSGPLHLTAKAEGTIERVALGLAFAPPTAIGVYGQRFLLPRKLDVVWADDVGVTVPKVQLRRVGGGTIELGGRLGESGKVAASLAVRDYPVGAIPGLDPGGKLGPFAGTLRADLALGGPLERPSLHGQISVAKLAMDRRPIGDVETNLRLGTEGGDLDATIDPGITLHARVRRRPALSFDATVAVRDRALGPWLPPPFEGAAISTSGDVKLGYRAAGLAGEGLLRLAGPGLEGAQLEGEVHGLDARAHLQGQIDISRWPQLWSRALRSAAGALAVDLTVVPVLVPKPGPPRFAGSVRVARALTLQAARWPAPISVPAGGRIELDGNALTVTALSVVTPGLRGGVAGRATLDTEDLARTRLELTLAAELDAARFPVRLPSGVVASGGAKVDARIGGTLGGDPGPTLDGGARLDNLTVQLSAATPAARANGRVEARGEHLHTDGLHVDIAGVGTVTIGAAGAPATVEVASLSPFRLGRVDVPFGGQNLHIGEPSSSLYLPDLDAALRLTGDGRGELKIAGQVDTAGGSYDKSRGGEKKSTGKPRVSGPWYQALPPHLTLDLELRGTNKGMTVAVPVLPDVTVDFQCHLHATNRGATWTGRLRGDSTYARAAVAIADWFTDSDLRKCQLTK